MVPSASSEEHQPPVGIDLGTTYSVVAYVDAEGRPCTIPNSLGDVLTPSAVSFDDANVLVGKDAASVATLAPDAFADCFKRDLGRPHFRRPVQRAKVPPEVLSAFVLESLRRDAEAKLGEVRRVVITVPAFFDETRRRATCSAGRLAGLDVLDIVNEPTAAAIAYGYEQIRLHGSSNSDRPQRVLVYDLGGGTFDVTLLEIRGNDFRALATDGDAQLGGRDFDERLVARLAEQFVLREKADPRANPSDALQLWQDAQHVKHALSQRSKTSATISCEGRRCRLEIARAQFEEWTADLLERTRVTTEMLVQSSGLRWDEIDNVLLVGGSTRMPAVAAMLTELAGRPPDRSLAPDEAVAHGAALYAAALQGRMPGNRDSSFKLVNVNSHSLGIVGISTETNEKVNGIVIPRNTPLPHRAVRRFKTARPNQPSVAAPIVEGESERPEQCISLGQCVVRDLPPNLPAGAFIDVEFEYREDGCIAVTARVPAARQSARVEIRREHELELGDLESWRRRLLGIEPAPSEPETGALDLTARLRRLYGALGAVAAGSPLPAALADLQERAFDAEESQKSMEQDLRAAEQSLQSAVSAAERSRFQAEVLRRREELERQRAIASLALESLGQACLAQGFEPAGAEREAEEIRRLLRTRA